MAKDNSDPLKVVTQMKWLIQDILTSGKSSGRLPAIMFESNSNRVPSSGNFLNVIIVYNNDPSENIST